MEGFRKCNQRFNTFDENEVLSILDKTLINGAKKLKDFFDEHTSSNIEIEAYQRFLEICSFLKETNFTNMEALEPFTELSYKSELDLAVQIRNVSAYILGVHYYQAVDEYKTLEVIDVDSCRALLLHYLRRGYRNEDNIKKYTLKLVAREDCFGKRIFHSYGFILPLDYEYGLECLRESLRIKDFYGMAHLVVVYFDRKLYTDACALGTKIFNYKYNYRHERIMYAKSLVVLSFCLHHGLGIRQDTKKSREVYEKAKDMERNIVYVYFELHKEPI